MPLKRRKKRKKRKKKKIIKIKFKIVKNLQIIDNLKNSKILLVIWKKK
jgi:hypothetical protein